MTLRVMVDSESGPGKSCRWVVVGRDGHIVREGVSAPPLWPRAERIEGVLPAAQTRLLAVKLPPLSRQRLDHAAAYAIEDQLAAPIDASAVAAAPVSGGATLVAVARAERIDEIGQSSPRLARLVPEAALAPIGGGWAWYASAGSGGFVRRADGSSFTVSAFTGGDALPPELDTALGLARYAGRAPEQLDVAFDVPAATLTRWQEATGIRVVAARPWRWQDASASAWADAPDFLARRDAPSRDAGGAAVFARFRLPLLLISLAFAIHVAGLATQWSMLRYERWQAARALVTLARQAGVAGGDDPGVIAARLAARHRTLLHAAGRPAPADALPLLARAAGSLAALPRGAVSTASYADGAWTLDLAGVGAKSLEPIVGELERSGIDALAVPIPSGMRVRLALDMP